MNPPKQQEKNSLVEGDLSSLPPTSTGSEMKPESFSQLNRLQALSLSPMPPLVKDGHVPIPLNKYIRQQTSGTALVQVLSRSVGCQQILTFIGIATESSQSYQ